MNERYLAEALAHYDLSGAEIKFIRHNENMTFQVDGRYLLRIHRSAEGFSAGMFYEGLDRNAVYRSEANFLFHLKRCGMSVQTPVMNKNGTFLTILKDGTTADLLTWIAGRAAENRDINHEICCRIGKMIAELHHFSRGFTPKCALRYDSAFCERMKRRLCDLAGKSIFDGKRLGIMTEAWDSISNRLKSTENMFIPIHSDLSLSNILITQSGLSPIDFSLFGYGHPMLDLSGIFCSINGMENRQSIAEGYCAGGGTVDFGVLDSGFALFILSSIVLHTGSWPKQDWFDARLDRWCREVFIPIIQGKPLFSEDYYLLNAD